VALGEVLTHGADILRPLGMVDDTNPDLVVSVLPVYRRLRRLAFHGRPLDAVRLVATDTSWAVGTGPEVSGRAIDLLLLLANRVAAPAYLTGPGLSVLR
jgi:hypothetical protein